MVNEETELERVTRHLIECESIVHRLRLAVTNTSLPAVERRRVEEAIQAMERLLYRYQRRRQYLLRSQE
jgi:hypothetical protein